MYAVQQGVHPRERPQVQSCALHTVSNFYSVHLGTDKSIHILERDPSVPNDGRTELHDVTFPQCT